MSGDAYIPSLAPYGLAVVPGPSNEHDDDARARWQAWRKDVDELRDRIHALCLNNPSAQADELAICANDPAYALAIFGFIEEPRGEVTDDAGASTIRPFIPMAFQVEMLQGFVRVCEMKTQHDVWYSKARGLGASWILCWGALWAWRFKPWRGALISAKEALVDRPHDVDSLFGKIDFMLEWLPKWWKPPGLKMEHRNGGHRMHLMLKHPDPRNPAQIRGDTTTKDSLRSTRATYAIYDEGAAQDNFEETVNTGAGTTRHQFGVSTESFEHGRGWRNICDAADRADRDNPVGEPRYVTLDWWRNPLYTPDYIAAEKERAISKGNLAGFEREFMRDPWAGNTNIVYPEAAKIETRFKPYTGSEQVIVGIDPGHHDDTAIVWGTPTGGGDERGVHWYGVYERNLVPVEYWAHFLTGIEPIPGDVCYRAPDEPALFHERELELMRFFRSLPWQGSRVRFVMDPAGAQKHSGVSFYDLLFKHTLELRRREATDDQPAKGIAPLYGFLKGELRYHDYRRNCTRPMLAAGRMTIAPEAQRIKDCLTSLERAPQGKNATNETKTIHNEYSHVGSAVEYCCVGIHYGFADPKADKKQPAKTKKLILTRQYASV